MRNKRIVYFGGENIAPKESIMLVDCSAQHGDLGFPFQQTSIESCMEVACPGAAHTAFIGSVSRRISSRRSAAVNILSAAPSASSSVSMGCSFLQA